MLQKTTLKKNGVAALRFIPMANTTLEQRRAAAAIQDRIRQKSAGWNGTEELRKWRDRR